MNCIFASKNNNIIIFSCLTENLVPNIFLELFFVMQLLTSQSAHTHDEDDEQGSLCAVTSGVSFYFSLVLQLKSV